MGRVPQNLEPIIGIPAQSGKKKDTKASMGREVSSLQRYIADIHRVLDQLSVVQIDEAVRYIQEARHNGRQVFVMGNGGSASTASHFACDLGKNTRHNGKRPLRVIALTDNMALFSALANDEGYDNVFAQQLEALARPNDLLLAISTSGNSKNVLEAVRLAQELKARTIGMTGFDGGTLGKLVDVNLHVPSHSIEQVEDMHLLLAHMITVALRDMAAAEASVSSAYQPPEISAQPSENGSVRHEPKQANEAPLVLKKRDDKWN